LIPVDTLKFIDAGSSLGALAHRYLDAMLRRRCDEASDLVVRALDDGANLKDVYLGVFQPVQYEIGWLWQNGTISVAHEHFCTNATQVVMARLYPRLFRRPAGGNKLLAACVQGELHEFGLRMLADFFEMAGWETHYLGANTPADGILTAVEEAAADLLAIGATMHDRVGEVAQVVGGVRGSARYGRIPILVGGYTFLRVPDLWAKVGADGTAHDAQAAIALGGELVAKRGRDA
jgi:methanogenic corrinoid protein MtbC1